MFEPYLVTHDAYAALFFQLQSIDENDDTGSNNCIKEIYHYPQFNSDELQKNLAIQLVFDGTNMVKDKILR